MLSSNAEIKQSLKITEWTFNFRAYTMKIY